MRELWSISRLNEETLLDRRTIKKVLDAAGIDYTSGVEMPAFIDALREYWAPKSAKSSLEAEKLRKTKEEADQIAMQNDVMRGQLVHIDDLCKRLQPRYVAMRQIVESSLLSPEEKESLLHELHRAHLGISHPPPGPAAGTEAAADHSAMG